MASEEDIRCYAPKRGVIDLRCELSDGHEGWHKAVYTDHREVVYDGAHHVIDITEKVTWEPIGVVLGALSKRLRKDAAGEAS